MWILAVCIGSAYAEPATGPSGGSVEETTPTAFHDQLAAAKSAINRGQTDQARAILERLRDRLDAGEQPPRSIAHEALVYLGDLRYIAGEQDGAREVFRRVLLEDVAYAISPYHHTEDVRAYFAFVRDQVERELAQRPPPEPVPPPRIPPLPLHGYAPLGIPQLAQGQTTRGVLYGGLQLLFASTSIGTYVLTNRVNHDPVGHPFNWSAAQVPGRVAALRYGVQWPATALFYVTWAGSIVDANASWRKARRNELQADVLLSPNGLVVTGRF